MYILLYISCYYIILFGQWSLFSCSKMTAPLGHSIRVECVFVLSKPIITNNTKKFKQLPLGDSKKSIISLHSSGWTFCRPFSEHIVMSSIER